MFDGFISPLYWDRPLLLYSLSYRSCTGIFCHRCVNRRPCNYRQSLHVFWKASRSPCQFKGCGMGPWLVLVSPCFRENEVATCKIGSFLCSLDNLLQKNVLVFFFGNQISKWRSFEKRAIFDLLFTFFSYQGKVTKIASAHISLTYIQYFAHPIDFFCLTNFENTNLSGTVSLWYESWCWFLFAPFWNHQ